MHDRPTLSDRIQAAGHKVGILNNIESQRAAARVAEAKAQELEARTREALDNLDAQKSQLEYARLSLSRTESRIADFQTDLDTAENALKVGFASPHGITEIAGIIAGLRIQNELAPKAILYWKSEVSKAEKALAAAESKLKEIQ